MSVPQEQESYIIFFQTQFLRVFFHLSFIAPDLEIFFFSFQGLESVSQEAILVSEAGEKEKKEAKRKCKEQNVT